MCQIYLNKAREKNIVTPHTTSPPSFFFVLFLWIPLSKNSTPAMEFLLNFSFVLAFTKMYSKFGSQLRLSIGILFHNGVRIRKNSVQILVLHFTHLAVNSKLQFSISEKQKAICTWCHIVFRGSIRIKLDAQKLFFLLNT